MPRQPKTARRSLLVRLSRVADQRMKKAHAVDMCGLV
jgi:hypothetical protein